MPLPLLMLIVFGAAKLFAGIFEYLGQPGIAGEILAGVLIGPSLLNWVQPGGLEASLGDLGVMFLLFRVGLEIKSSELWAIGRTAALVAACGVIFSFLLVWGVLALWGVRPMEAAFVSAGLAATSVGITAQVLWVRGLIGERASRVVLAAAVIDDICGLLLLAVVSSMAGGKANFTRVAATAVGATLFVAIVVRWGAGAVRRVISRQRDRPALAGAEFSTAVCLLFALALFSLWTGISTIVGAFLAGLVLAESVGARLRTLVYGATELLVPFFLVGIGLRVNVAALRHPATIALAAAVFLAAVAAKVAGCGLGALHLGWLEGLKTGVGMVPRGEVTMVVAQLGLTMGAMTDSIFGVTVVAAIGTTLVAPAMIRFAFRENY